MAEVEPFCSGFLVTLVDREGLMQGTDLEFYRKLGRRLTAAGGITTLDEIAALEEMGVNSQLGMALYQGKIDLTEATLRLLKFDALIPTIVQNAQGQILMLAYSSTESLRRAFASRRGVYFSRSRNALWIKGESSGNEQELLRVRYDCDRDALLFTVRQ
jgi:phosphoribosyl-AMP cyclohydrolase